MSSSQASSTLLQQQTVGTRRTPFPHTVEVAFNPTTSCPELLFNFTHSSRGPIGDTTKAAAFHAASTLHTIHHIDDRFQNKVVRVPYPPGLKRLYYARAGNVGLEFDGEASLKDFHQGILGVGHVLIREEAGIYRCYLGDKVKECSRGNGLVYAAVYGGVTGEAYGSDVANSQDFDRGPAHHDIIAASN